MEYLPHMPLCMLPDQFFLYFRVWEYEFLLLTITTMCDFERGGAMKPIIGSSWNNGVKNCLDLYQVQKRPNLIMLIVFLLTMMSANALAILLEAFLNISLPTHTHTHTNTKALLYPCCACVCEVTSLMPRRGSLHMWDGATTTSHLPDWKVMTPQKAYCLCYCQLTNWRIRKMQDWDDLLSRKKHQASSDVTWHHLKREIFPDCPSNCQINPGWKASVWG